MIKRLLFLLMGLSAFNLSFVTARAQNRCEDIFPGHLKVVFPFYVDEELLEQPVAQKILNSSQWSTLHRALYGKFRSEPNHLLTKALEILLSRQMLAVIMKNLTQAESSEKFAEKIITEAFRQVHSSEFFTLSRYSYKDLLLLLKLSAEHEIPEYGQDRPANFDRVELYLGGRGEYAYHRDSRSGAEHFYQLDPSQQIAFPIERDVFFGRLQWQRPEMLARTPRILDFLHKDLNSALLNFAVRLHPEYQSAFRYAVNALSPESYRLLADNIQVAGPFLIKHLHPEYIGNALGESPIGLRDFFKAVWQLSAGKIPKLKSEIFSAEELAAIAEVFDGGVFTAGVKFPAVAQLSLSGKNYYFYRNITAAGQVVYIQTKQSDFLRRRTEDRFPPGNPGIPVLHHDTVPASDLFIFPPQITRLPPNYLYKSADPHYQSSFAAIENNLAVLTRLGRTPKAIAERLIAFERVASLTGTITKFTDRSNGRFAGRTFEIVSQNLSRARVSEYDPSVVWTETYLVWDLRTGRQLRFDAGLAYRIAFYGEFDGLDPEELVNFIWDRNQ